MYSAYKGAAIPINRYFNAKTSPPRGEVLPKTNNLTNYSQLKFPLPMYFRSVCCGWPAKAIVPLPAILPLRV